MFLQVTLFDNKKIHRPVSTLVQIPMKDVVKKNFKPYRDKGIQKICIQRRWGEKELKENYSIVKVRIYEEKTD